MHDVERVAALALVQGRKRAPGAADGEEILAAHRPDLRMVVELFANDLLGELDLALRLVQQRQAADRQADALPDPVAIDRDQLQRAAAEIADDAMRLGKAGNDAEPGEIGLAPAGDQLDALADRLLGLDARNSWPLAASRAAAVAMTRIVPTCMASHRMRKRTSASSALAIASSASRPVVATCRPSPAISFSLKTCAGARASIS
jgi:hypothetical protein